MPEASGKKRIFIVDDHPCTRQGLASAIDARDDLCVCGEASGWHEAMEKIERLHPDVVMLDLGLPDGYGWTLIEQLKAKDALPPTIVLSMSDEEYFAPRLLRAGARGYMMKTAPLPLLVEAIHKVLAGHIAVSDRVASRLISKGTQLAADASEGVGNWDRLSDRELQVLELLRQGLRARDIAGQLGISRKTVDTYKARLMEKLGIQTDIELRGRPAGNSPPS